MRKYKTAIREAGKPDPDKVYEFWLERVDSLDDRAPEDRDIALVCNGVTLAWVNVDTLELELNNDKLGMQREGIPHKMYEGYPVPRWTVNP